MTDNIILESLQQFLKDNVAGKIKLQKASDSNASRYELVNPAVHIGWIPPKGMVPKEMDVLLPCLIVGFDQGQDDGSSAEINIRLSAAVYNPGTYDAFGKLTPDFNGYKDLINLIFLTRKALSENPVHKGRLLIQKPFQWGMYQEQPYPYWYGWLTFSAQAAVMEKNLTIDEEYYERK